ncbi:MAG: septum formation initiator family protein [bacterium]|nr:septum formation initiator family protein [bacterium]
MLEKFDWKQIAKFSFFITLFLLGGGMILMSHLNKMRLQEKRDNYQNKVWQIRKENEALRREKIELAKEDSEATKRQLRNKGFVKEGEKIIKFSE